MQVIESSPCYHWQATTSYNSSNKSYEQHLEIKVLVLTQLHIGRLFQNFMKTENKDGRDSKVYMVFPLTSWLVLLHLKHSLQIFSDLLFEAVLKALHFSHLFQYLMVLRVRHLQCKIILLLYLLQIWFLISFITRQKPSSFSLYSQSR